VPGVSRLFGTGDAVAGYEPIRANRAVARRKATESTSGQAAVAVEVGASRAPRARLKSASRGVPLSEHAARQVTPENSAEVEPGWSHDGRWIYFASNRGGAYRIWKAPFEGGAAQQVTQGPGLDPVESPDGRRVYYFRPDADGIWTVPVSGGQEEAIPELNRVKRTRAWAVRENGIYFYEDGPGARPQVQFFNFTTRRVTTVLRPEVGPARLVPALEVSPDGRTVLYTQIDQRIDGLFVIENFR